MANEVESVSLSARLERSYDVAEWQHERWDSNLLQIQDGFFKNGIRRVKVDSFSMKGKAVAERISVFE